MSIPAVITFAGSRDHYQLPLALAEVGLLDRFITDIYFPADRIWLQSLSKVGFAPELIHRRYVEGLNSNKVGLIPIVVGATALSIFFHQLIGKINRFKDSRLGSAARARATSNGSAIFTYSYYAGEAFAPPWDQLLYRFLFQVHPHTYGARNLLREELERVPHAAASLMHEYELSLSNGEYDKLAQEMRYANGWVVASSFTAEMLDREGIPHEKIHVVPYGVDHEKFAARDNAPPSSQPFTIIYIGSLIQRKGLAYLFEAIRLLKTKSLRLILCGRGFVDTELIKFYSDVSYELHIGLPYTEMLELLRASDVFVFPSLLEGFGHVLLESMACGVPIIASVNTAAPDLIEDGKEGFVVPIRDAEALAERLDWAIQNRPVVAEMGRAASLRAKIFTWERFRAQVRLAYFGMLADVQE